MNLSKIMSGTSSTSYEDSLNRITVQFEKITPLSIDRANSELPDSPAPASPCSSSSASRMLKFGVDRILSDDINSGSVMSPAIGPPVSMSPAFLASGYRHLYSKDDNETGLRNRTFPTSLIQSSSPPCSGCVSSILRCCRIHVGDISHPIAHYRPTFYASRCPLLHTPKPIRPYTNLILESDIPSTNNCSNNSNGNNNNGGSGLSKRKRSWSRAVFSNLQRKGLEKRFQMQKYITKPDRRQLAATLGLTDAQVKVWFQNRRMKWRHSKELKYHSSCGNTNVTKLTPTSEVSK